MNDIRKDLAKEVKIDLARFIRELLGVLILNCLKQWFLKRMLSWIVVRQKQLVESRQLDAVKQGFLILALKWTLWTDHGSVLLMVTGAGTLKSLVADSYGMDQHLHFGSRKRASSCRHEFA